MFEDKKDDIVQAIWDFIDGYQLVNKTEPTPEMFRQFIRMTIQYLPEVVKFRVVADTPPDLKEEALQYLIDKIYRHSMERLSEMKRGTIE